MWAGLGFVWPMIADMFDDTVVPLGSYIYLTYSIEAQRFPSRLTSESLSFFGIAMRLPTDPSSDCTFYLTQVYSCDARILIILLQSYVSAK
jgi:hypothetical protein